MSDSVTVRKATAEDEAAVTDYLQKLAAHAGGPPMPEAHDTYLELISGDKGEICVAEENGDVVGVCTWSYATAMRYAGEYANLEELFLDDSQRGKGTGAKLVNACIDACRQRGCADIGLYALPGMQPFYEKLGFVFAGPQVRYDLR